MAFGNFIKFTTLVELGTNMSWLDFEVRVSEVNTTAKVYSESMPIASLPLTTI